MPRLKNKIKIANRIKEKSIEAYLLCIEIYNKPTINYRIEASSYFICNAWELLLKAYHISQYGEKSIYKQNSEYSYSLIEMLNKYYEDNSPVKKNLLTIIKKIRDKSTHLIIKEHDILYTPLLQKAVLNYSKALHDFFNIDISEKIPFEYLALISRKEIKPKNISKLYSKNYAKLFHDDYRYVIETIKNTKNEEDSIFAQINYTISFTKDMQSADIKAYYSNSDDAIGFKKISVPKDSNLTHPFTMGQVINEIKKIAAENGCNYNFNKLNKNRLSLFNKTNNISKKQEYCYGSQFGTNVYKKYSQAYIDLIFTRLKQDPNLFADKIS